MKIIKCNNYFQSRDPQNVTISFKMTKVFFVYAWYKEKNKTQILTKERQAVSWQTKEEQILPCVKLKVNFVVNLEWDIGMEPHLALTALSNQIPFPTTETAGTSTWHCLHNLTQTAQ